MTAKRDPCPFHPDADAIDDVCGDCWIAASHREIDLKETLRAATDRIERLEKALKLARQAIHAAEPIAGRMRRMLNDDLCGCDSAYPHSCGRVKATDEIDAIRRAAAALSPQEPA